MPYSTPTEYQRMIDKLLEQDARIAALEAENKLLLAALRTAETYYPRVALLIVEDVPTPAPTIRALLNGGGK